MAVTAWGSNKRVPCFDRISHQMEISNPRTLFIDKNRMHHKDKRVSCYTYETIHAFSHNRIKSLMRSSSRRLTTMRHCESGKYSDLTFSNLCKKVTVLSLRIAQWGSAHGSVGHKFIIICSIFLSGKENLKFSVRPLYLTDTISSENSVGYAFMRLKPFLYTILS